jgi:ribosome biogenesis protein NSA1
VPQLVYDFYDFVQVELLNPLNGDSLAAVKTVGSEANDSDALVALHLFTRQTSDSM